MLLVPCSDPLYQLVSPSPSCCECWLRTAHSCSFSRELSLAKQEPLHALFLQLTVTEWLTEGVQRPTPFSLMLWYKIHTPEFPLGSCWSQTPAETTSWLNSFLCPICLPHCSLSPIPESPSQALLMRSLMPNGVDWANPANGYIDNTVGNDCPWVWVALRQAFAGHLWVLLALGEGVGGVTPSFPTGVGLSSPKGV
jgi:hypothetical protein